MKAATKKFPGCSERSGASLFLFRLFLIIVVFQLYPSQQAEREAAKRRTTGPRNREAQQKRP